MALHLRKSKPSEEQRFNGEWRRRRETGVDAKRVRCSTVVVLSSDGASPPTCERKSKPAGTQFNGEWRRTFLEPESRRGGEGQPLFDVPGQPLFEVSSWDFKGMWFMGL